MFCGMNACQFQCPNGALLAENMIVETRQKIQTAHYWPKIWSLKHVGKFKQRHQKNVLFCILVCQSDKYKNSKYIKI